MNLNKYAIIRAMRGILTHPIKSFSIHELARETKLAPSAAKYALDYMALNNMVKDEMVGKTHQYKADLDNFLTRQWKTLFSIEELHQAGLIEDILKTKKNIMSIILYGSVATGKDDEKSDVDIIVIADTDPEGKRRIMTHATGTSREMNIQVYTPMEWRKKASVNKAYYDHVIMESIALYGEKPVVL